MLDKGICVREGKTSPGYMSMCEEKQTEKVTILVPSPAEMCTMQIACRYKVNRTGQDIDVVTVEYLPDLSSSTSTHAIAQHNVGFYELDSLVYIVVLSKVSEYSFCSWG